MALKITLIIVIIFILSSITLSYSQNQIQKDDLIVTNSKIFTGVDLKTFVEAAAVKNGKIIAVGTNDEITDYKGEETRILDANRKTVVTGFIDVHCHLSMAGNYLQNIS